METTSIGPSAFHLITVGADAPETTRTEKIAELFQPISAEFCASLDEMKGAEFPQDAVTIVRLFGRANTQALTWLGSNGRVATEVAILGFADAVLVEPGQPPRAIGCTPQAFLSALAHSKIRYDLNGAALLLGATDETKVMAACLSRLGFKRIKIVDGDDRKTDQIVQYLRRRLLGIDIETVPRRTLTQVPNEAAIAVSLIETSDTGMLEDISYLNFLKKNGIWIDWKQATLELGLESEIKDAGAFIFEPASIRAWREALLFTSLPKTLATPGQKPEFIASQILNCWKNPPNPSRALKTDPP